MATTDDQLFPDFIENSKEDWYPFCGILSTDEQEKGDILFKRAKQRPYAGHAQIASVENPKNRLLNARLPAGGNWPASRATPPFPPADGTIGWLQTVFVFDVVDISLDQIRLVFAHIAT